VHLVIAPTKQTQVVIALGSAQTLAWGSTYQLVGLAALIALTPSSTAERA